MAVQQLNAAAPARPPSRLYRRCTAAKDAPAPARPGVVHIKYRHRERFTVVGNHLAQHRELSLLAIGLAVHIQSVPDGTRVDIKSLTARFPEGEARIAAALRELETYGYLTRTARRAPGGRIVTHTVSYDNPGAPQRRPHAAPRVTEEPRPAAAARTVPPPPPTPPQATPAPPPTPPQPPTTTPLPAPKPPLPEPRTPDPVRQGTAAALLAGLAGTTTVCCSPSGTWPASPPPSAPGWSAAPDPRPCAAPSRRTSPPGRSAVRPPSSPTASPSSSRRRCPRPRPRTAARTRSRSARNASSPSAPLARADAGTAAAERHSGPRHGRRR